MNCIDRGEAMNLLNEAQVEYDENYKGLGLAKKIIDDMKPVKPERPKGHWKRVSADKYVQHATYYCRCSECGEDIIGEHNYCPNCGADMRGE